MLPGNAVDHLHAVVGEWQLLADLSFADYLMWVRRDDGVWCASRRCGRTRRPRCCWPTPSAPLAEADRMPLVTAAFKSGAIGRESEEGQADSAEDGGSTSRPCRCATTTTWSPSSRTRPHSPHARPARWNAPTSTARAICCTCCPKAPSPTSTTCRYRGPARASVTGSSGSTWQASWSSPARTRCRPITAWASPPSSRGRTWSR